MANVLEELCEVFVDKKLYHKGISNHNRIVESGMLLTHWWHGTPKLIRL